MKVLIVGGVAGGAGAAARLRRDDENAEIILMERGGFISFANCGLPYYIGSVIEERSHLLLQTPESFRTRFRVDVRVKTEVLSVDGASKQVLAKNLETGETYTERYDKLILSPGAKPIIPMLAGMEREGVFTLRCLEDAFAIKDFVETMHPNNAVVIGGGYIGLEMAENLKSAGMEVTIVERMPHVIATLDEDMAAELQNHIRARGIRLLLGAQAEGFEPDAVLLSDGSRVAADLVLLSVGVQPETAFLTGSGVQLGKRGEILVNSRLETSLPDVYAVGDAIAVKHIVSGKTQCIPLASPANKQARIVADIVAGKQALYSGAQGTAIAKVFQRTVAVTGCGEAQLQAEGIAYRKSITFSASNASYYPGGLPMTVKLLFTPNTGRLLGAQIVGGKGVDKRIDVLAVAIRHGMTVFDLQELELAYAPPFSSAKDPVNMAGYVAGNIVEGTSKPIYVEELRALPQSAFFLDVRTPEEFAQGTIGNACNLELDCLRARLAELPRDRELILFCRIGLRGYLAQCILEQNGFSTRNLIGGYQLYEQMLQNNSVIMR